MPNNPQKRARPDFAPHTEDQWQLKHSTLTGAFGYLFMNDLFADVRLVPLKNASSPPKKFPAHKLVLRARSSVFSAQFFYDDGKKVGPKMANSSNIKKTQFGDGASSSKRPRMDEQSSSNNNNDEEEDEMKEIRLPNCEPDAFEQFLRFLYTDEGTITDTNARPLLEIATFYSVRFVEERCRDFIVGNLSPENVGETLKFFSERNYPKIREQICDYLQTQISPENSLEWFEKALLRGHQELAEMAMEVARDCAALTVQSPAFFRASQKTLECFASQPRLTIDEKTLFNAFLSWARQLLRRNLPNLMGKSLRELLGPALQCVHFWHMTKQQFTEIVKPSGLLSPMEIGFAMSAIENGGEFPFASVIESKRKPFIKSGKIEYALKNAVEFSKTKDAVRESEPIVFFGLPWQLRVLALDRTNDGGKEDEDNEVVILEKGEGVNDWQPKRLAFKLRCNGDAKHKHWECHASVLFRVLRAPAPDENVGKDDDVEKAVVGSVQRLQRIRNVINSNSNGDKIGGEGPSGNDAGGDLDVNIENRNVGDDTQDTNEENGEEEANVEGAEVELNGTAENATENVRANIEQSLVVHWRRGAHVPREAFLASNKIAFVDILCPEKGFLDTAGNNTIRVEVEIAEAPPPTTAPKREFWLSGGGWGGGGDDETASNASDSSTSSTRAVLGVPITNLSRLRPHYPS